MINTIEDIERIIESPEFIQYSHSHEMLNFNLMLTLRTYMKTQLLIDYDKMELAPEVLHFINECSTIGQIYESDSYWIGKIQDNIDLNFDTIEIELTPTHYKNSWVYFDKISPIHLPQFLSPNDSSDDISKEDGYYQLYKNKVTKCSLLKSSSIEVTKTDVLKTLLKNKLVNKTNYQSDVYLGTPEDVTTTRKFSIFSNYDINDEFKISKIVDSETGVELDFMDISKFWIPVELGDSISFCQSSDLESGLKMSYNKPRLIVNLKGEVLNNPPLLKRF